MTLTIAVASVLTCLVGLYFLTEFLLSRRHFHDHSEKSFVRNIHATEALNLLLKTPDLTVVDVRPKASFDRGHLPGAINVEFTLEGKPLDGGLAKVPPEALLLVYCDGGFRSRLSLGALRESSFDRIYHLHRGLISWKAIGGDIEKSEFC